MVMYIALSHPGNEGNQVKGDLMKMSGKFMKNCQKSGKSEEKNIIVLQIS